MWPTVAVSIEFYLGSHLFAHHYTGSASPGLPLECHWPCAGLFARSFIYAIQISTPFSSTRDANRLAQGCCGGTDRERAKERDRLQCIQGPISVLASFVTPTLCWHRVKC